MAAFASTLMALLQSGKKPGSPKAAAYPTMQSNSSRRDKRAAEMDHFAGFAVILPDKTLRTGI